MRDLGTLGEDTFKLLCSQAGLVANGSKEDKTGWDFHVEAQESYRDMGGEIHSSPIEYRVQVKATDHRKGKLPIKLSNLWRMCTLQMPAYYVFIEFDGKNTAQRVYVVHVDHDFISKVLKRLHELEQAETQKKLHKTKLTIHYEPHHCISSITGDCLKEQLNKPLTKGMSDYISDKKQHLEKAGYDYESINLHFTTSGEKNLNDLIDVSIGLTDKVEVDLIKGTKKRFGIVEKNHFIESEGGFVSMEAKPFALGNANFKEGVFESGLSFRVKVYLSPFYSMVPDELKKFRMEGDFFDIVFFTMTDKCQFSISAPDGLKVDIREHLKLLKLIKLLTSSGSKLIVDLYLDNNEKMQFFGHCNSENFLLSKELKALENALAIVDKFDMTQSVEATLGQIMQCDDIYSALRPIIEESGGSAKIEFDLDNPEEIDIQKPVVNVVSAAVAIGDYVFGIILAVKGLLTEISPQRYRLYSSDIVTEKKMVTKRGEPISNDELRSIKKLISDRYESEGYDVLVIDEG